MTVDLDKLRAEFPASAIKQRAGGHGRMLSYVEGFTVIRRLNDACPAWDFTIVREWQEGNLLKAQVQLCIPSLGCRQHMGVQVLSDRPGTEDMQAKGHITDALKKAATLFGVGLELYGPDYEAGEFERDRQPSAREQRPEQTRPGATASKQKPYRGPNDRPMSHDQMKRLMGYIAPKQNLNEEDVRAQVFLHFAIEHIHEMTVRECSWLMDELEAGRIVTGSVPAPDAEQRGMATLEEPPELRHAMSAHFGLTD